MEEVDFTTKHLLESAQAGETDSEAALIARFQHRLIALAASQLPTDIRQRIDPDDVVQSVCRIFIDRVRSGQITVSYRGELWQNLATVTVNKIRSLVRKHRNSKRSVLVERMPSDLAFLSREPTPDEACMLVETIELLFRSLPNERQKRVILLRLLGESTTEIARSTELSVERVRQIIRCARLVLENELRDPV